jgi:hypothetical protein
MPLPLRAPFIGRLRLDGQALRRGGMIMARIDLWRWSATRVEIDHRAREARLRLEHLERLLKMRALPAQSWVSRILYRREGRFFSGGRMSDRSTKIDQTGERRREARHFPAALCGATSGLALAVRGAIGTVPTAAL